MKKILKVFNGFFNEKDEGIEINDKQAMLMILQLFLGPVLKGLKKLGDEAKVTRLLATKSLVVFLNDL